MQYFTKQRVIIALTGVLLLVAFVVLLFQSTPQEPAVPDAKQPTTVTPEPATEEISVIGQSVQGRDITAYRYGTGERHLLFVGGIHGGYEWNSIVLAYELIDYIESNPSFVPDGFTISIIPSANPDGVFKTLGTQGRFTIADVPETENVNGDGRFNARGVDLNRNFACKWQPESTWRGTPVSAGTSAFSEPETATIRDYVLTYQPDAVVFFHSQSNAVYASECTNGVLPETTAIMNAYAQASGYRAVETFDAYEITGDAEGWLASIGIPAITVELSTHETVEWDRNLAGITALLAYYTL